MQHKTGLDAHIIKKYSNTSLLPTYNSTTIEPEKVLNYLGIMGMVNIATQNINFSAKAA